jgi:hypothetical protein
MKATTQIIVGLGIAIGGFFMLGIGDDKGDTVWPVIGWLSIVGGGITFVTGLFRPK